MKRKEQEYIKTVNRLLHQTKGYTDWNGVIRQHMIELQIYQQERLHKQINMGITAIVTVLSYILCAGVLSALTILLSIVVTALFMVTLVDYVILAHALTTMYQQYEDMNMRL